MYLVDTNVFLEILLTQEKKNICKKFLTDNSGNIYINDFSLHTVGVILFDDEKEDIFLKFANDILSNLVIVSLEHNTYGTLPEVKKIDRTGF